MENMQRGQAVHKQKVQDSVSGKGKSALQKYQDFFIGSHKLGYTLQFELVTGLFGSMPGAVGFFLRKMLYPGLFRQCGKGVIFGHSVSVRFANKISLGRGVAIDDYCLLDARDADEEGIQLGENVMIARNTTLQCKGSWIRVGNNSAIGSYCRFSSSGGIEIGNDVMIAGYSYIGGGRYFTDDLDTPIKDQGVYTKGSVVIGDGVWIAAGAIIQDGVRIGRGSVISAGAVVQDDVPENTIVVAHQRLVMMPREKASSSE